MLYCIYTKQKFVIDFILVAIKFTFYFNDDQGLGSIRIVSAVYK